MEKAGVSSSRPQRYTSTRLPSERYRAPPPRSQSPQDSIQGISGLSSPFHRIFRSSSRLSSTWKLPSIRIRAMSISTRVASGYWMAGIAGSVEGSTASSGTPGPLVPPPPGATASIPPVPPAALPPVLWAGAANRHIPTASRAQAARAAAPIQGRPDCLRRPAGSSSSSRCFPWEITCLSIYML